MAESFLDAAAIAELNAIKRDGFATLLAASDPAVSITLWCDDEQDGTAEQVGPTPVIVAFAARQAQIGETAAARTTQYDGTFRAVAPWAARRDCRFTLPDGSWGRIALVPWAQDGEQLAFFVIEAGA